MSRSNLPVSLADRVAATFTLATIVALVWLILAAPQESPGAAFAEPAMPARQVDELCDVATPVVVVALLLPPAGSTKSVTLCAGTVTFNAEPLKP